MTLELILNIFDWPPEEVLKAFLDSIHDINPGFKIYGFGSFFNGHWDENHDIDIILIGGQEDLEIGILQAKFKFCSGLGFHVNTYPDLRDALKTLDKIQQRQPGHKLFKLLLEGERWI